MTKPLVIDPLVIDPAPLVTATPLVKALNLSPRVVPVPVVTNILPVVTSAVVKAPAASPVVSPAVVKSMVVTLFVVTKIGLFSSKGVHCNIRESPMIQFSQ